MRIEIAKEGRMDMSGQGLIRAIQNNNMPLLDLLVREAIQNSLDAARADSEHVKVDFGVDEFDSLALSRELEGITETLLNDYPSQKYSYLYIRDKGTEGLTGALHFSDKKTTSKQNLLKLVYEIAKPQDEKGAGGSWGYGKTIYYRIGIGLVVFYSRVQEENGVFQERLSACLVEDEKKPDALLRDKSLNSSRGLAWWGEEYLYNSGDLLERGTIPVTDSDKIRRILSIFDIKPFEYNETGTLVLIPYIDEKKLLTNNINHEGQRIPWGDSIEEYLRIAVQRWYIGRLNNPIYSKVNKRPWLSVEINGSLIEREDIAEPFEEIQILYNMALLGDERQNENGYFCEPIRLMQYFDNPVSGYIAYKMYSPKEMGMEHPINNPNPFIFVKNEDASDDYKNGDIILSYFRKPGMTVTYDTDGEWVNKIKCNNENSGDVLFVVFVLKSDNRFNISKINTLDTIEEYFRSSEKADHMSWYDITVDDTNPRLLNKIQKQIGKKVSDRFKKAEEKTVEKSSSLSKLFGELLLPPEGFGKKPGTQKPTSGGGEKIIKHKYLRMIVDNNGTEIHEDKMILPVVLKSEKPFSDAMISFEVLADGSNIPIRKWYERVGIPEPFYIESVQFDEIKGRGMKIPKVIMLNDSKNGFKSKSFSANLLKAATGKRYGISFSSEIGSFSAKMKIVISIQDRMTQLGYSLNEGE